MNGLWNAVDGKFLTKEGQPSHEADLRTADALLDVAAGQRPLVRAVAAELLVDERRAALRGRQRCAKSGGAGTENFSFRSITRSLPLFRLCDEDRNLTFCARLIIRIRRVCRHG